MKKHLLLFSSLLLLITGLQLNTSQVNASNYVIPPPDETLVKYFLQQTYATEMLFEGSNQNWDSSYTVSKVILSTNNSHQEGFCPRVKIVFVPKATSNNNEARKYQFKLHTTNGCLSKEKWLFPNEFFSITVNAPIATPKEYVLAEVVENSQKESINLSNTIPSNIISPEQALRTTFMVYYQTYGCYPTKEFTFELTFFNYVYWLVTIDDHDGIGGLAYLTINAFTGKADAIREDE